MITGQASERRSSTRHPIRLPAQLEVGSGAWPCEIADVCAEGLFLRYSTETARQLTPYLGKGSEPLQVAFQTADDHQSHRLQARAVRHIDGAMGVEFTRSDPVAISALLRLCEGGEEGSATLAGQEAEPGSFILRQCIRASQRYLEPLMEQWFQAVDKQLGQAAEQAADQLASQYLDAALALRTRQRPFWHMMSQLMEAPARVKPEPGTARASTGSGQLDLVDKSEFEDWLMLRVLVTKAETEYRGALLQMKMRLDKAGVGPESGHQNPLGPILVCDAFRRALEHLNCSRAVDKVAFRVFEQEVVWQLGGLYEELNQILVRQGLLPDLDLSKYLTARNPAAERAADKENKPPASGARTPPDTPVRCGKADGPDRPVASPASRVAGGAGSVLATVGRLLQSQPSPPGTSATAPSGAALSGAELQRQLAALALPGNSPTATAGRSLRDQVLQGLPEDRPLGPEQAATLDVVDRFFSSLRQSPRLAPASLSQLEKLGIPVFHAVLEQQQAFEDESSPVRGVLNRVAQLGMRGGRPNPVLQRRIDALIGRINEHLDDARVFESALVELDELVARQNLAYRRNVERVTAAAQGAQKVEEARLAVTGALARRLDGQKIPRALVTLLEEGWRDLLTLTYVRQGPESSAWQDHLAVVDILLAFTRDPDTTVDLRALLGTIQNGLGSISSNQKPAARVRDELKRFLTGTGDPVADLVEAPVQPAPDSAPRRPGRQRLQALERWISRAQALELGDWLKFQEKPEQPGFVRLVWIGKEHSRYVFVNHQGMKVVELDLYELASHLEKGILVTDPGLERPIVDESIDRMVWQVYEQNSRASTRDPLTGLSSRREFERRLGQWLATAPVSNGDCHQKVLVVLELQGLRELSDSAGFEAGDRALRDMAHLVRRLAPSEEALARLGGPRFGLLVPAEGAEALAQQYIEALQARDLVFNGRQYRLSVNVGLAIDQPGILSSQQWLEAVEDTLARCRREGRQGLVWYSPDADQNRAREQLAERFARLEELDRERVLLRTQKIIPLHAESRLGIQHQALFSIYDDHGQLIHGASFVRMAQRHQRVPTVDCTLVGYLLDWMARHSQQVEALGGLGIALSASSLADATLLESIFERMSEQDAPIENLWFEISEAATLDNVENLTSFMTELSELGSGFCLSHFSGQGASYDLLKQLPVDRVKLDGTFTADLLHSKSDQAMVRSMAEMVHFLGREVIATDIEEKATLDLLVELGVDYGQGGAIDRPRPLQ